MNFRLFLESENQSIIDSINELVRTMGLGDPTRINQGDCDKFANELVDKLKSMKIDATLLWDTGAGHTYVRSNGKFYDAETPNRVSDPSQLLFFARRKEFVKRLNY